MRLNLSPIMTIFLFAFALWLRNRVVKVRQAAKQARQNQAFPLKSANSAPSFPKAAPLSSHQVETYQNNEAEPLSILETEENFSIFENLETFSQNEQQKPGQQKYSALQPALILPKINSNTLIQAIIAHEVLTRPVALRRRFPNSVVPMRKQDR
ncbi:MAG: hypothetical protein ACOX62_08875 [Christensenellales bacterium]|jgi:hypothetical protein